MHPQLLRDLRKGKATELWDPSLTGGPATNGTRNGPKFPKRWRTVPQLTDPAMIADGITPGRTTGLCERRIRWRWTTSSQALLAHEDVDLGIEVGAGAETNTEAEVEPKRESWRSARRFHEQKWMAICKSCTTLS